MSIDTLPVYSVVGDRYTFLLTGKDTGGDYAVFEFYVPPGNGPAPHVHTREDESFQIIDGDFEFTVDGQVVRLGAGEFLLARRNIPHSFKNIGARPGRIVATVKPAGLEEFFAEVGVKLVSRTDEPIPPTPDEIARLVRVTHKYGLTMLPPAAT